MAPQRVSRVRARGDVAQRRQQQQKRVGQTPPQTTTTKTTIRTLSAPAAAGALIIIRTSIAAVLPRRPGRPLLTRTTETITTRTNKAVVETSAAVGFPSPSSIRTATFGDRPVRVKCTTASSNAVVQSVGLAFTTQASRNPYLFIILPSGIRHHIYRIRNSVNGSAQRVRHQFCNLPLLLQLKLIFLRKPRRKGGNDREVSKQEKESDAPTTFVTTVVFTAKDADFALNAEVESSLSCGIANWSPWRQQTSAAGEWGRWDRRRRVRSSGPRRTEVGQLPNCTYSSPLWSPRKLLPHQRWAIVCHRKRTKPRSLFGTSMTREIASSQAESH